MIKRMSNSEMFWSLGKFEFKQVLLFILQKCTLKEELSLSIIPTPQNSYKNLSFINCLTCVFLILF